MLGKTVSHYKIIEKIGAGGMGEVYKAEDTKLKRTVALKFLPPSLSSDPQAKKRFIQEARAASALDHPHICTIHEIGETDDGRSFIAMACYEGLSLREKIKDERLKTEDVIGIVIQIAKGLARAHEEGIVHRDIKPANIMITGRGEVKILDFGLAKLAGQSRLTKTGSTVGTVAYMSPEQAKGEPVNQRTDIWSLGVILYEMLTGDIPFRGDYDQAVIYSILNEDPEPLAETEDIPHELHTIIKKTLAKDPDQRYQTIEELLEDFKPLSTAAAIPVELALKKVARRFWRKHKVISLITAAVFAGLIFLWIFKPGVFSDQYAGPREIAVISFENLTGDPAIENLAQVIPGLLMNSLSQSQQVRILPWDYLRDQLKQLGHRDVKSIDRELGYQLCEKVNIYALVTGNYSKIGNSYVTDVKVIDPQTKELIVPVSTRGETVESILYQQVDELSQAILEGIDAVDDTYLAEKKPVNEITTHSAQAYQYYLRGWDELYRLNFKDSERFYQRAVDLDSTFALAHWGLARVYNSLDRFEDEQNAIIKAYRHVNNSPPAERDAISAHYITTVEKDLEKMVRFLDAGLQKNPYNKFLWFFYHWYYGLHGKPHKQIECIEKILEIDPQEKFALNIACYNYAMIGEKQKALEYIDRYKKAMPGEYNALDTPGEVYYLLGMLEESKGQYQELNHLSPAGSWWSHFNIIQIYALQQNYEQTRMELEKFTKKFDSIPRRKAIIRLYRALFFYYMGQISSAYSELDSILIEDAVQHHWVVSHANELRGYLELEQNDITTARNSFEQYNADPERPDMYDIHQAMIYFKEGNLDSCINYRNRSLKKITEGRKAVFKNLRGIEEWVPLAQMYCDLLRVETLLARDSIDQAIEFYKRIEFPIGSNQGHYALYLFGNVFLNIPLEKDLLPRAFIEKGDFEGAIRAYEDWVEFQPDQKDRFFINPKYHYRLAKLYQQTGQRQKAIERYKIFLDIWKYADKDLPELLDAKKRLASLNMK